MMILSAPERAKKAAAQGLIRRGDPVRLALRGSSMQPTYSEPMELVVRAVRGRARIGDVIVFLRNGCYVAHRVVDYAGDRYVTSGDAQPHIVEYVAPESVLGAVASPAGSARGLLYARLRRFRAAARNIPWYVHELHPDRHERAVQRLFGLLAAFMRDDGQAFAKELRGVSAAALVDAVKRHRCAAIVALAIRRFDLRGDPTAARIYSAINTASLGTAVGTLWMKAQIRSVVDILRNAGIEVMLLKGAARIYADDPGADLHPSGDIDVLVPFEDQAAAVDALRAAGYDQRADEDTRKRYLREHHHAAPLTRAGCAPVEVHVRLAPPHTIAADTSAEGLSFSRLFIAPGVYRLDHAATIFHMAIHAVTGGVRMRDVYLAAECLRAMTEQDERDLRFLLDGESRESVRVNGVLCLAAKMAGRAWKADPAAYRYAEWLLLHADLPGPLRRRCGFVEAAFAYAAGGTRHGIATLTRHASARALLARLAASVAVPLYLRSADAGER